MTADLISLRYDYGSESDGQKLDLLIANPARVNPYTGQLQGKYDLAFAINDNVEIWLTDTGKTADRNGIRDVYPPRTYSVMSGKVQNVTYGPYDVTIEGCGMEDELSNDFLSKDKSFHPAIPEVMVKWLLADRESKDGLHFTPDIRIDSDVKWNDQIFHSSNTYRECMDLIKDRCGCTWWSDVPPDTPIGQSIEPVFHFITAKAATGAMDLTDTLLIPSTSLSAIGTWNDITVISGGTLPPGEPGSEIQTTKVVRGVFHGTHKDDTGMVLSAPTLYNPNLTTVEEAQKYADNLADYSKHVETNKTGTASPICLGIDPPIMSSVYYYVRGDLIQGKVIHKTIEFSADGWITHLEVVRN